MIEMKKLSLQSRIVFNYVVSAALLTALFSLIILFVFHVRTSRHDDALTATRVELFDSSGHLVSIADDESELLMTILFRVCIVGFFFNLALFYAISRLIARHSVKPVRDIISISNSITHNNLSARIPLPDQKDELYELSDTINRLLDRIENAIAREKSFTSYASHEFRTPLAVIKGTLEVIIRRPRSEEEYKNRITACIKEVDKLNNMVEQLLFLTRYEESKLLLNIERLSIETMLYENMQVYTDVLLEKKLAVKTEIPAGISVYTDNYFMSVILKNLISNAVKYSNHGGVIAIKASQSEQYAVLEVANTGRGIPKEEQGKLFDNFYRLPSADTKGFGLGLPIVKRFCQLLNIGIDITSEVDQLTIVKLTIPLNNN